MTPVVRAAASCLAACLCAVGAGAHAASNVQVDTGVLDELGPPSKADTGGPVVLTPPHRETGPAETKPAGAARPAGAAKDVATTAVEKPAPVTEKAAPVPARSTTVATKATVAPAETKRLAQPAKKLAQPAAATTGGDGNRLVFARGSADLPDSADRVLAPLVKTLAADPTASLAVAAYAEADEGGAAGDQGARRLALSRGLAVRRYLEAHGVAGTRAVIDARGAEAAGGPADRVDLAIAKN